MDWKAVFAEIVDFVQDEMHLELGVDSDILLEVEVTARQSLAAVMPGMPNVAKVAGHVSFWIRKLKPIYQHAPTGHKFLAVNELVGLLVGLSICITYFPEELKDSIRLSKRVFLDWVFSLRRHGHTPHSCALCFEILTSWTEDPVFVPTLDVGEARPIAE